MASWLEVIQGNREGRSAARTDLDSLRAWYDSLSQHRQDALYTLHEIKEATGIPASRLPPLLWRTGWSVAKQPRFPGVSLWHGPVRTLEQPSACDSSMQNDG